MLSSPLTFMRLRQEASMPVRATGGSLGYDLTVVSPAGAGTQHVVAPGQLVLLPTGLAFGSPVPLGLGVFLFPRSSLYKKYGVILANSVGVIDNDYQDEIMVPVLNLLDHDTIIPAGERVAQLVPLPIPATHVVEVGNQVGFTGERSGGFGSTDVRRVA